MSAPASRAEAIAAGVDRYFTGVPCKHGHLAERKVSSYGCVECGRVRARRWAADHPERFRNRVDRWHQANAKRMREVKRKSAKKCYDQRKAHAKYLANKEKILLQSAKWKSANRDKVRQIDHARRARLRGAEGTYTEEDVKRVRRLQKDRCAYCRCKLHSGGHIDHIKPIVKGGSNWPRNLQLTCPTCNLRKNAKDPSAFAQELGMLI